MDRGLFREAVHKSLRHYAWMALLISYRGRMLYKTARALFCKDTQQEGEVIAARASTLLGTDNREREQIENYLRKVYRVRK